jgi:hypothetical protein
MTERPLTIEEFGPRVTNAWNGLRPTTRHLLENAWQSSAEAAAGEARPAPYDHRADLELTQLLSALDERAGKASSPGEDVSAREAQRLADACANMLARQTQSADVFAQLIQRAHGRQDYARLDQLANAMAQRLAPSELCDLARSNNVVVRALAHEVLAQAPVSLLSTLLHDPVDAEVARAVLARLAHEFESEEARRAMREIDDVGN